MDKDTLVKMIIDKVYNYPTYQDMATARKTVDVLIQQRLINLWQDKEKFEQGGTEVIAWLSSDVFQDQIANLIYIDNTYYPANLLEHYPITGWYWAHSEEPVKRPDLINGVIPYPKVPIKNPHTE